MFVFESQNNLTLDCIIAFDSDSMSYECKSIDEFKKYAFGKTIRVKYMNVYVSENWVQAIISIYVSHSSKSEQQEFILSSENEMLVISLRDALLAKKKGNPRLQPPTIIQYEDNSIHIGDGNKISNSTIASKNTIETKCKTSNHSSQEGSLASKGFWEIFVPIIVIIAGAAICAWLGLNWSGVVSMPNIGNSKRQIQNRVVKFFLNKLHYTYWGNLHYSENRNIMQELPNT